MPPKKQICLERVGKGIKLLSGETKQILRDVSFTWGVGEYIGVIGVNGIGKTTLLRLIADFEKPTRGKILRQPGHIKIGVVFQRPEDHFSYETVKRQISSHANRSLSLDEIFTLIDQIGLDRDLLLVPPYTLSTGQQRLVAIAAALAKRADFYILDEPMAGLDAPSRRLVLAALQKLKQSHSIGLMLVSHHPDDLLGLVHRLLILSDQQVIYDGALEAAPLEALQRCLADQDPSLYLYLRQLFLKKPQLGPTIFHQSSYSKIAIDIEKAMLK